MYGNANTLTEQTSITAKIRSQQTKTCESSIHPQQQHILLVSSMHKNTPLQTDQHSTMGNSNKTSKENGEDKSERDS
jgi:hypothetical protein